MGDKNSHTASATLLAAVSVIAISVGMEPAIAADSNGNNGVLIGMSKQHKDSTQIKGESNQHKGESFTVKMDSNQHKMNSSQIKMDSNHIKIDSNQMKGTSVQQKHNTKTLNPQPEPPG
jgi:hypothetical protein